MKVPRGFALLGGMARKYFECYSTTWGIGSVRERAKSAMDAGYRAYRMDAASLRGTAARRSFGS